MEMILKQKKTGQIHWFQFIFMWSTFLILTIFFGMIASISSIFFLLNSNGNRTHSIATLWAKSILYCNPWWTFKITGTENLPTSDEPVIYVVNHQSQADILAIYLINTNFRWLAKASLFKIPIVGWGMSSAKYVPVKRNDPHSREKCLKLSAAHLKNKTSMLFFPEGTRSPDGVLRKFKGGAFRLAKQMNVAIVPITIQGCSTLLPKGSMLPNYTNVEIYIHKKISQEQYSAEELMNHSRDIIASALPEALRGKKYEN